MIGTVGNSGTKQGFYNKKGGYKLHFEVLQSKEELDWVSSGPLDFRCTSETWRIDPECFLGRPFGVSSRLPVPYYKLPVGLDFIKNIKEAKRMNFIPDDKVYSITTANMTLKIIETLLEGSLFANIFRSEGKWNMRYTYKNNGLTRVELTNLGNYNYGLTGTAAEYSRTVLHLMAGLFQVVKGKGDLAHGWRLDNPKDTIWINRGIEDFKAGIWEEGATECI